MVKSGRTNASHAAAKFLSRLDGISPEDAAALAKEFGSLNDVISAHESAVERAVGRKSAATISQARSALVAALESHLEDRPLIELDQDLIGFLQVEIGYRPHERVITVHLDHHFHLIGMTNISVGDHVEAPFNLSQIVYRALKRGAAKLIIAHNHPSGDPTPSEADRRITSRLKYVCDEMNVHLVDHIILARGQYCSLANYDPKLFGKW